MTPSTVNFLLTLFIATLTVTVVLWLALYASGQAEMNVTTDVPNEETAIE